MGYKRRVRVLFLASEAPEAALLAARIAAREGGAWLEPQAASVAAPSTSSAGGGPGRREIPAAPPPVEEALLGWADVVITLDRTAEQRCPSLPQGVRRRYFALPVEDEHGGDAARARARWRDELTQRILALIGGLRMMERDAQTDALPPPPAGDPPPPEAVAAWRRQLRPLLIARRNRMDGPTRRRCQAAITEILERAFPIGKGWIVGLCWPYKGEYDARFPARTFRQRGAVTALPAVVDKRGPLEFRRWWPGAPTRAEVYGIPVPVGTAVVTPHVAFVPPVAFDDRGYRLGYGGGYFDRTLAAAKPRPIAVAVAFEMQRLPDLLAQPHDIPMDFIVTEAGVRLVDGGHARFVDPSTARTHFAALAQARGLPEVYASQEGAAPASPPCYARDFPGYFGQE
ncbi:5-formyltetrahydrofolate cyclo-ligase [Pelomicrobium methylotrophicum]|uniref:5-formyltetrahydrofolate cyclo-ligase n=1 Tax=Pelomicrobium methylotrophicum TaxID=2602750 RepID=UPI001969C063|nr:5-formyltetrahydrofolate cyclo-ligase [Pelomicrobium methylotrophicum]